MDRRDFLKSGCIACLSGLALSSSCTSYHYATGTLVKDGITLPLSRFGPDGDTVRYVVIRHEKLRFPVCLFKNGTDSFTALWMQCSHQGAELQVAGNQLTCPAHGSAFDHLGNVAEGPAARALRTFPVAVRDHELFIDLRKPNT